MSTVVVNRLLCPNYFKIHSAMITSINYVSSTQLLFVKKRFSIKNKFTFQNEFPHKQTVEYSELGVSPNSFCEQKESNFEHSDMRTLARGYISSDLLAGETSRKSQHVKRLSEPKNINKQSLSYQGEILFGVHPVYLAMLQKKRIFHQLFARIDSSDEKSAPLKAEIMNLAKLMNIPISYVDTRGLKILAPGAVHQGICLDAGFLPLPTWNEDLYQNNITEKERLWLVLDEILDPMNVGAIIRSAYYFGVDKVFTVKGNSCKLSPTVSKASSGSLEVMNIYQTDNLENFIKRMKESGWSIVSTLAYCEGEVVCNEPPINVTEFSTSKPTILILGNEGRGISEGILKLCDLLISIEPGQALTKGVDSLNVSVAAGVILYALNLQIKNIKR